MTKPRVYDLHEALERIGAAVGRGRPLASIRVKVRGGVAKILRPKMYMRGTEYGIEGDIQVRMAPRYLITTTYVGTPA